MQSIVFFTFYCSSDCTILCTYSSLSWVYSSNTLLTYLLGRSSLRHIRRKAW